MDEQTTLPAKSGPAPTMPAMFNRLRGEIDRLFEDFSFARPARSVFGFPLAAQFHPLMELTEKKGHYDLSVELPGMEEKDIDIECADGVLTISGEKRDQSQEETDGYLMSERHYGAFRRTLTLPADADPEAIDAKFAKGVLRVKVKKDANAARHSRKIPIS